MYDIEVFDGELSQYFSGFCPLQQNNESACIVLPSLKKKGIFS